MGCVVLLAEGSGAYHVEAAGVHCCCVVRELRATLPDSQRAHNHNIINKFHSMTSLFLTAYYNK